MRTQSRRALNFKTGGPRRTLRRCLPHLRGHQVWVLALVHQRLYEPQRHLLHAAGCMGVWGGVGGGGLKSNVGGYEEDNTMGPMPENQGGRIARQRG